MKAIYEREVRSYFNNMQGYIFTAFVMLFTGIYTMVINLKAGYPNFSYVVSNMSFIFLIVIPILTMRIVAEERKQKTDQLLYSLPISMTKIVLGKYLAAITVIALPIILMCFYPLILSAFGTVYLHSSFGSIVAFFLLGAALAAIGTFISSITDNQAVAAGICFAVMLLIYFISSLASYLPASAFASLAALMILSAILGIIIRLLTKNSVFAAAFTAVCIIALIICYILWQDSFVNLFPTMMEQFSLFERFYVFADGVFDFTGIIYYLTIIAVSLFLTVQSLEKRRWS